MDYLLTGTLVDGTPIYNRVSPNSGAQHSHITLIELDPFAALRGQVAVMGTAGTLSKGNTNALLVQIDAAQAAL